MTKKSKGPHGGPRTPRPGNKLGRPPKNQRLRIIKIQCTPEELQRILASIPDTRRRTEILLSAVND